MGSHRHEEAIQDFQLALRGQRVEIRVEVYIRFSPSEYSDIDFLILQLQPTFCLSELKALHHFTRPLRMSAHFYERGVPYRWGFDGEKFDWDQCAIDENLTKIERNIDNAGKQARALLTGGY